MELKHVALVSRSEEDADLFFGELLGLTKEPPKTLPASLALNIFAVGEDMTICNYTGPGIRFEVFITPHQPAESHPIPHICLQVPDRTDFLKRCLELGFPVLRFPKGDKTVIFIKDGAGNLYEIKSS